MLSKLLEYFIHDFEEFRTTDLSKDSGQPWFVSHASMYEKPVPTDENPAYMLLETAAYGRTSLTSKLKCLYRLYIEHKKYINNVQS